MFALALSYLNGWSMAADDGPRKEHAEWPPHPDRVFMALAAAWFETGEDAGEGDALRWLEGLEPPAIAASDACQRASVVSYVPVNDDGHKKISNPKTALAKLRKKGLAYLPEYRSRQPRGFPVAIPHDPTVRFIWRESLGQHAEALGSIASKVTHVGHSASFVQAWVEKDSGIKAIWEPTEGIAALRLRIPSRGSLARLGELNNRDAWITYHDLRDELDQAKAELKAMKLPPRVAWREFPCAVLLASEWETMGHPDYAAAKSGDAMAAARLVDALVNEECLARVRLLLDGDKHCRPLFVSASAYECEGFNSIPDALAKLLGGYLDVPSDMSVVQTNIVKHTGADGYGRLARQAAFEGKVEPERAYIMVDDFIGQGGTLANLRGWIEKKGGEVIGAVGLTGKPYSAKLNPTQEQLHELRQKHGSDFEEWWRGKFGHAFDCLTQSEARYLARSPDVDTIRDRLAAAVRKGGGRSHGRIPREQRQHIKQLTRRLDQEFPQGVPRTPERPKPGKWQAYSKADSCRKAPELEPHSIFHPRIIVLAISGRRVSLPTTLKLTAALRGLLMRECPVQPPPEWFSGHGKDGRATTRPHLALAPLPFVGAKHADGRIMGLAMILPRERADKDAGSLLGPVLHPTDTGQPREHRLFDGDWFECRLELDIRETSPLNLRPDTWTRPSRVWASVTPVVLNRHFDGPGRWELAAESVKDACEHIGLPRPDEVLLHPVSLVEGVPHAREFPPLRRKSDGGQRNHAHAVMTFEQPVLGPVLVGAGRFRGYGLCRPHD